MEPTGISLVVNIPALALNEQAPYGFVWYVNPYPREVSFALVLEMVWLLFKIQWRGQVQFRDSAK